MSMNVMTLPSPEQTDSGKNGLAADASGAVRQQLPSRSSRRIPLIGWGLGLATVAIVGAAAWGISFGHTGAFAWSSASKHTLKSEPSLPSQTQTERGGGAGSTAQTQIKAVSKRSESLRHFVTDSIVRMHKAQTGTSIGVVAKAAAEDVAAPYGELAGAGTFYLNPREQYWAKDIWTSEPAEAAVIWIPNVASADTLVMWPNGKYFEGVADLAKASKSAKWDPQSKAVPLVVNRVVVGSRP